MSAQKRGKRAAPPAISAAAAQTERKLVMPLRQVSRLESLVGNKAINKEEQTEADKIELESEPEQGTEQHVNQDQPCGRTHGSLNLALPATYNPRLQYPNSCQPRMLRKCRLNLTLGFFEFMVAASSRETQRLSSER